jgi:hypothetical protein
VLSTERPDGHDEIQGDGGCTRASHLWSFSFSALCDEKGPGFLPGLLYFWLERMV